MVSPLRSTGVIETSSGFWTRPLTTYSKKVCMNVALACGRCCGLGLFLDKAGDRLRRLGALRKPIIGAIQIQREIVLLLQRQIGPQFLEALAVARAAAVSHHNAERRLVLGPNPLQSYFYRHKDLSKKEMRAYAAFLP